MEAYKVVLLGSSGTGAKTSLIRYILGLPFDKNIGVTMGANFTRYKLGENNLPVNIFCLSAKKLYIFRGKIN